MANINIKQQEEDGLNNYSAYIPPYCEKCGTMYDKNKLELIDKNSNMTVVYIMCDTCNMKNIFYIVKPLNIINRARLVVDLDIDEIKKFAGSRRVDTDDILNIFKVLSSKELENSKDFFKLINRNV